MSIEVNGLRWREVGRNAFVTRLKTLDLRVWQDLPRRGRPAPLGWSWEIRQRDADEPIGRFLDTPDRRAATLEAAAIEVRTRAVDLSDESCPDIRGLKQLAAKHDRHLSEFFAGR